MEGGATRLLGIRITPLTRRRWQNFRRNKRGYWSLWIFLGLFLASLGAEGIANDRPILVRFDGHFYFPMVIDYPETTFGGFLETPTEYADPDVKDMIEEKGWIIWPLIPFSYDTVNYELKVPAPAPPSELNWLGTDDQGRDVIARTIYGFRISVLFGLILTVVSSAVGVAAGAVQGYFGGKVDLIFQRVIEMWAGMPQLYLLIILTSVLIPGFWILLGVLLLFSWMSLVGVVRAEFLRARNFDYVRAARALGVSNAVIMFKHILPNVFSPIIVAATLEIGAAIISESALSFLGLGFPSDVPTWGAMLNAAQPHFQIAPYQAIVPGFFIFLTVLSINYIGDGLRDALDPRKTLN